MITFGGTCAIIDLGTVTSSDAEAPPGSAHGRVAGIGSAGSSGAGGGSPVDVADRRCAIGVAVSVHRSDEAHPRDLQQSTDRAAAPTGTGRSPRAHHRFEGPCRGPI